MAMMIAEQNGYQNDQENVSVMNRNSKIIFF